MSYPVLNSDDQHLRRLEQKVRQIAWQAVEEHSMRDTPEAIARFSQQKAARLIAKHNLTSENQALLTQKLAGMIEVACQETFQEQRDLIKGILDSLAQESTYGGMDSHYVNG